MNHIKRPDIFDHTTGEMLFYHACSYYHYHNSKECPKWPKDPTKRITKHFTTYEAENNIFDAKVKAAKKKFPQIKSSTIIYACQFNEILKLDSSLPFVEKILPNLYHFSRLCPRDANFGGVRQVFCREWSKTENQDRSLYWLDLNSAHSFICANYTFPYGKCRILIGNLLDDIQVIENCLTSVSTGKQLCGLIKARILPNQSKEPFLPVRIPSKNKDLSEVFHAICYKCLEEKSQSPCQHKKSQREMTVTTTIESFNFSLQHGYCELIQIHEIWVSK